MSVPDSATWLTTNGDTVEVYPSVLETSLADADRKKWRWRYRVKAANNRVVETGSESYIRKDAAVKAALRHHPRVES